MLLHPLTHPKDTPEKLKKITFNPDFFILFSEMTTFREWVHYRYGTYSEMGFESDPLYPSYYQSGPLEKASVGCRNLTLDSNLDTEQMVDTSILRNKVRNWYLEIETTLTHTAIMMLEHIRLSLNYVDMSFSIFILDAYILEI